MKIDANLYIDSLPTFKDRPENFTKDLSDILLGEAMRAAMAALEEQALLTEKQLVDVDFTQSDAMLKAIALKEKILGFRAAIEYLVTLANGDL